MCPVNLGTAAVKCRWNWPIQLGTLTHMPRRWRAGIRIGGGALRVNTRTPADDHLYRGFSHAYQSQVDHVSSIFCHHFLISFGTRYSGTWHIDHICFAIWIWDRFPWICFIHWLYVFHVIILLQFLWPDKGYTSLKQRTDGSLFLSTSAWCQVSIPSNQCMLRSG